MENSKGNLSKRYVSVRKNRDFQFLFRKGESVVNYAFVCYFRQNRLGADRLGIVASKKIGNAVKRNRARRVIREAFRLARPALRAAASGRRYDFIFVARGKTPELKTPQIYGQIQKRVLPALSSQKPASPGKNGTPAQKPPESRNNS